ncbi:TRAFs-binding domain-containing protein [Rufibacter aurantiacus]|uniref:TRAFs-binding domain-containing protein n=1 Tax=Rufibacter aurantiacus TaxID=2817374 RepID=UPI001B300D22|nr:TRAFs-binding domain-containing protein [Rufibacter aurantiacus]
MEQIELRNSKIDGVCFVVMGFGKKTDFETGRVLDLDKSYRNMIKPAVEAAGLKCIRADEIVHSGIIDVPMYEQLLKADVVVADLSTSNKNALYELGIRHALRPYATVVIAEDGIKAFPFDINHVLIRQYHHLGEDIGFEEVMRFREQLTSAIKQIIEKNPRDKDSPVYTFLSGLTPPALAAAVQAKVQEAIDSNIQKSSKSFINEVGTKNNAESSCPLTNSTHSMIMEQVDDAQKKGDWVTAKSLLSLVRQMKNGIIKDNHGHQGKESVKLTEDCYILQRLALTTYKSKIPTEKDALLEAQQLLTQLNPGTSNDTETLGLWGAVHKRLWETEKNSSYLDEAIRAYERGFYIRNDYYNGINFAFLLNLRAAYTTELQEAIADFVQAQRVRKEVITICDQWLKDNPKPYKAKVPEDAITEYSKNCYWVKATMGEAFIGLGAEINGKQALDEAYALAPEAWMKQSTEEQMTKLRLLLEFSPLRYLK